MVSSKMELTQDELEDQSVQKIHIPTIRNFRIAQVAALTLLVAESNPKDKERMIELILLLLKK